LDRFIASSDFLERDGIREVNSNNQLATNPPEPPEGFNPLGGFPLKNSQENIFPS